MEKTGTIGIHTENIFPVIKKWLYSDHEVFLRELVSNAYDAITKRNQIAGGFSDHAISITINKSDKTITISDTGLGMDADELERYLAQIAFSSAEEFLSKFDDDTDKNSIIGHFGLGFYSAFMVSDTVEVQSKSYKDNAEAAAWICDGTTNYTLKSGNRETIGTDIILHINSDSESFLEEARLKTLVEKYTNFLPLPISVNDTVANHQQPLWVQAPSDVQPEQYQDFYKTLFPFQEEPLFWIHLNVDYPFNLTGILYFPKVMHELDATKGQVKLYCKQIFVSDQAGEVIPEFLTLLQGAIDCPDIPLNVSRSYLQNDPYVQKISKHIVKKVADKLSQLRKQEADQYAKIWPDISPFIKYGMMQNADFYEKMKANVLFESSTGDTTTVAAYIERNADKLEKKVLYCADKDRQATYVTMCKDQGLEVLFFHALIDSHFVQFLESKDSDIQYVSVDSEINDSLVDADKAANVVDEGNQTSDDQLLELFKSIVDTETISVEVKALKSDAVSAMFIESEQIKRLKNMQHFMKGAGSVPGLDVMTLVINNQSPVIQNILNLSQANTDSEFVKSVCLHVIDLARLSKQQVSGESLQTFIARANTLLSKLSNSAK
ncbi:molecular chaperone HtpG [bacterium]|nr:molecular chaperone HtpG [bacterium]|tara:strand:- start:68 stop:1888 length:1821 start_codon:yes stop_codon:yes gene_type:complete